MRKTFKQSQRQSERERERERVLGRNEYVGNWEGFHVEVGISLDVEVKNRNVSAANRPACSDWLEET